jgi:hypothetical protein
MKTRGVAAVAVGALLAASIGLRLWRLDTLPGVNGDEAWYGVQMLNLIDGQAFDWRTPPGNLLNPFFSGLVLLLQWPLAPHFWIVRAPAVVSTLLAAFAAMTLWRFLAPPLYVVAGLLLATLPVTIAYGRFGWDSSQSILVGVLVVHCVMTQRWILAGVGIVLGMWVHPTNIFLAPLVFVQFAFERPFQPRPFVVRSTVALVVLFAAKQLFVPPSVPLAVASIVDRTLSPAAWGSFVVGFGRLFSGATSYTYIAGPLSPANLRVHDVVFWLLVIAVTLFGSAGVWRSVKRTERAHLVGWVAMVAAFFVVAGPEAVAPHFERYALVLVAPTILTVMLLLGHAAGHGRLSRHVLTVGCVVAAACLVSVSANYIHVLAATGGESHRTFRTASREPKAAALDWIRAHRASRSDCAATQIVAEDWWAYWPLQYLAYRDRGVAVVMSRTDTAERFVQSTDRCSYLVGFAGGQFEGLIAALNLPLTRIPINDPLDRPILFVWSAP